MIIMNSTVVARGGDVVTNPRGDPAPHWMSAKTEPTWHSPQVDDCWSCAHHGGLMSVHLFDSTELKTKSSQQSDQTIEPIGIRLLDFSV